MRRIVILMLFLFAQKLCAQSVLRLQHISVEEGLSQSSVNHIFQDAHGFMWFATGDGLNRYDGKDIISYKSSFHDTSAAHLSNRNINSKVFEDRHNKLWLNTDEGISYLDWRHGKFAVAVSKYTAYNAAIVLAIDGDSLWAVVPQSGFYVINVNNRKHRFYPFTDKLQIQRDTVCIIHNGALSPNGLWVADNAGLLFFNKYNHSQQRIILNDKLNAVHVLHDGHLVLTTNDGIYLYDTVLKKSEFISIKNEIASDPAQWKSLAEDFKTHTIYLGASNSGIICKLNLETRKQEMVNFQGNDINCLFIDQSQNLWIGTEGNGLYKLDIKKPKFFSYTPNVSNSLNDADGFMVKSIYRNDSGKIWLGTYDRGLIICDPVTHGQKNIPLPFSIDGQLISTIFKDSSGSILVTVGNKVLWLDPKNGRILKQTRLERIISASPVDPIIFSLVEWKKDHYLVGTNIGMYVIENKNGAITSMVPKAFRTDPALNHWVYTLHTEKDGTVYIGFRSGFARLRMLSDTAYQVTDHGFEGISVRHFYKSSFMPVLWIATEKGLLAYNEATRHFKAFDETDGLANSSVYGILAQNDSSLWISTNQGLSNLKIHYGNDTDIKVQFINYSSKDGLQSNEFNSGAYYKCPDGTFIFGGIAGINWFKPGEIVPNPYKAMPAITNLVVDDHLFAADTAVYIRSLTLPYNRNTISFSLRALEFTKPEQNRFAYILQGVDKDWVYTTSDKVRYVKLPPGSYTFLLKVSNNEGIWNEQPLSIQITVLPPYWETWWFRALVAAGLAAAVYLSIRYYINRRIKAKTQEFEKQQALYMERMRISKDVHDDLGSGLSKIALMAAIAQKKTGGNANLGHDLQQISAVSKELVDSMRELIWVLNPDNTTLEHLVARLREYCADYLENMPLKVVLEFPDMVPAIRISREVQRNIFLTTKESINNCVKHSGATEIRITLALDDQELAIAVNDNGKGFDMAHLKGTGNGLRNMKQRIEQIGGVFGITSMANNTTVRISIPFDRLSTEKIPL